MQQKLIIGFTVWITTHKLGTPIHPEYYSGMTTHF